VEVAGQLADEFPDGVWFFGANLLDPQPLTSHSGSVVTALGMAQFDRVLIEQVA